MLDIRIALRREGFDLRIVVINAVADVGRQGLLREIVAPRIAVCFQSV